MPNIESIAKQYGISKKCPSNVIMQKQTITARQNSNVFGAKNPISPSLLPNTFVKAALAPVSDLLTLPATASLLLEIPVATPAAIVFALCFAADEAVLIPCSMRSNPSVKRSCDVDDRLLMRLFSALLTLWAGAGDASGEVLTDLLLEVLLLICAMESLSSVGGAIVVLVQCVSSNAFDL